MGPIGDALAGASGESLIQAAEVSLSRGAGPAGGVPMNCTVSNEGGTCSSVLAPGNRAVSNGAVSGSPGGIPAANATPSPRFGAAMALFSNGSAVNGPNGVLLFGGASSDGAVYNDTWQFNEGNLTWWNVTPYLHCIASSCPRGRFNAMMTWDVSDSVTVMFGGCSTLPPGWAGYLLMFGGSLASSTSLAVTGQGDTWSLSGSGLPGAQVGWTDITLVA